MSNEFWIYNKTDKDIVFTSLGFSLKAHSILNVYDMVPKESYIVVKHSIKYGALRDCIDNQKVCVVRKPDPNKNKYNKSKYLISKEPALDRSRSIVYIDSKEKNFIDQLEEEFQSDFSDMGEEEAVRLTDRFVESVDLDGFIDDDFVDNEDD